MAIIADHSFFRDVGLGSVQKTVEHIFWIVKESNALLMSKDFDDDGRSERVGLSVDSLIIFTSPESKGKPEVWIRMKFELTKN